MYSDTLWNKIHEMEYRLYGGPVSSDQIFDRDGNFLDDHPNRRVRDAKVASNAEKNQLSIWYKIYVNPNSGKVEYLLGE